MVILNADFERLRHTSTTIRKHDVHLELKHLDYSIRLRPMTENDWPELFRWNADPDVVYYSEGSVDDLHAPEEIKEIYRVTSQNAHCFIIECNSLAIGECWLQGMNIRQISDAQPGKDCRRIDIMIGDKSYWNRGIGTAVIRCLVSFGFGQQNADMIFGLVSDHNKRSIGAFQKAGFSLIGKRKVPEGSKGKFELQMCISKTEYMKVGKEEITE